VRDETRSSSYIILKERHTGHPCCRFRSEASFHGVWAQGQDAGKSILGMVGG